MSLVCKRMEKISLKDTIREDEEMAFRFWACVGELEGKSRLQVANSSARRSGIKTKQKNGSDRIVDTCP
jgi:hypothetical protein